jgi:competence protein ComEA
MIRTLIATVLAVFALNAFAAADANQASRAELETVKGIGPGLSGKIVKARETGQFKNWGDLVERVGGIGAGNAGKLSQAGLTVAGAAYDGSATVPAKAGKAAKTAPGTAAAAGTQAAKDGSPAKKARKAAEAA